MNAILSGSAGVAILLDSHGTRYLRAGLDVVTNCNESELAYLLGDASDLIFIEKTSQKEVSDQLAIVVDCEDALAMSLILMDSECSEYTRNEAAGALDELLVKSHATEHVKAVLFAKPAPASADLIGATRLCETACCKHASLFISELTRLQGIINFVHLKWIESVRMVLSNQDEQSLLQVSMLRHGIFSSLVQALDKMSDVGQVFQASLLCPVVKEKHIYSTVLQKWFAPFLVLSGKKHGQMHEAAAFDDKPIDLLSAVKKTDTPSAKRSSKDNVSKSRCKTDGVLESVSRERVGSGMIDHPNSVQSQTMVEDDFHSDGLCADKSTESFSEKTSKNILKKHLHKVLSTMSDHERILLDYRYGQSNGVIRTIEEVGKRFSVPRKLVRQIEIKAVQKVRRLKEWQAISRMEARAKVISENTLICQEVANEKVGVACGLERSQYSSVSTITEKQRRVVDTTKLTHSDEPPRPISDLDMPRLHHVLKMSPKCRQFRNVYYPDATDLQWADWRWQIQNRIHDLGTVQRMIRLTTEEEKALELAGKLLPMAVTPHYMGLVSPTDPDQAIRRSVIPTVYEMRRCPGEADDPLGEEHQSPVPGLVHRYPDRVLLLATDFCSTYCRYCTRSRVVSHGAITPNTRRLQLIFDYIRKTPQIRDVLISGGDPLTLSDDRLEYILSNLRAIPRVEIIRIGTKIPAVLPQRITPQFVCMLRKYHPLWMNLHFTHPDECCYEAVKACSILADAGIPLGSETVLLKGVNDNSDVMEQLMQRLMIMRVKPCYLCQCDPISGSQHFRTSVAKGKDIIRALRGRMSGYAVPTYVIEALGGGGKIPIFPDYEEGKDASGNLLLRNYKGCIHQYPDDVAD